VQAVAQVGSGEGMKKWWRFVALACVVVGGVWLASDWLRLNVLRTLMLTTADPDALGLVASESMEPVTLTLAAARMFQVPDASPTALPVKQSISIRIPAAFVNLVDLREGAEGSQRIGFELWSGTLEPVAPDVIADRRRCTVGTPCTEDPAGPAARRRRAGEWPVQVQVTNGIGTEAQRAYVLRELSGVSARRPCKVAEDAALGMVVVETPPELRPGDACNFTGNPGIRNRDGRSFPPKNFVKRKPDGATDFVARCDSFASEEDERAEIRCRLHGYFGIWPMTILLWGLRPTEWSGIHDRIQEFLARHVVTLNG
jgi:hypothetical protein